MYYVFNADKLPEAIATNLQGFSWSFSHFFLWRAFRVQFDCGEGAAIRLDDHVFRTEVLALSHAHSDHCRGLMGFLEARAGLKGDTEKPLIVLYPKKSAMMAQWIDPAQEFCEKRGIKAAVFQPIEDGGSINLRNGRVMTAKAVSHEPGDQCLAYRIGHMRRLLKAEFRSLPMAEVARLAKERSRNELDEEQFECEIVYSGDTDYLDPQFCLRAQVLIHEASFLFSDDADAGKGIHANVSSALKCAMQAGVRALILFHSSRRYEDKMFTMGVQSMIERAAVEFPVVLIRGSCNVPTD